MIIPSSTVAHLVNTDSIPNLSSISDIALEGIVLVPFESPKGHLPPHRGIINTVCLEQCFRALRIVQIE